MSKKQTLNERLDADTQQRIEHVFLSSTKYAPVQTVNVFENGLESVWNVAKAYQTKKELTQADAAERDLYGAQTWQEFNDDL